MTNPREEEAACSGQKVGEQPLAGPGKPLDMGAVPAKIHMGVLWEQLVLKRVSQSQWERLQGPCK